MRGNDPAIMLPIDALTMRALIPARQQADGASGRQQRPVCRFPALAQPYPSSMLKDQPQ